MKNRRFHSPALDRILNAAPGLRTCTTLKNDVTVITWCNASVSTIAYLVTWSITMIAAANSNHLRMLARLSGAKQVGNTPPAQQRMLRIGPHVRAIVPATIALGMRTGANADT